MNEVPTGKPTLQDLMVFTATTAVGLALTRYYLMTPCRLTPTFDSQGTLFFDPGYTPRDRAWFGTLASFFLASWSMALLASRIRSPRPRFRAMICGPGFLVPAVATLFTLAFFAQQWAIVARDGWPLVEVPANVNGKPMLGGQLDLFSFGVLPRLRNSVGLAAMVAMVVSVLASRGRAASDWVDRLGLALGLAWIVIYFL